MCFTATRAAASSFIHHQTQWTKFSDDMGGVGDKFHSSMWIWTSNLWRNIVMFILVLFCRQNASSLCNRGFSQALPSPHSWRGCPLSNGWAQQRYSHPNQAALPCPGCCAPAKLLVSRAPISAGVSPQNLPGGICTPDSGAASVPGASWAPKQR